MVTEGFDLEDWRLRIAVDGNNAFGILHARQVLYGARDAHSNVEIWSYNLSCLSNLEPHHPPALRALDRDAKGERECVLLCNPSQAPQGPEPGLLMPLGLHRGKDNLCSHSNIQAYLHVVWDIPSIYCCSCCANSTRQFIS